MNKNWGRIIIGVGVINTLLACGSGGGSSATPTTGNSGGAESSAVFVIADRDIHGKRELYKASFNPAADDFRMTSFEKISAPSIDQGDVMHMKLSPDKRYIAYIADAASDEVYELYVARTDGSGVVKVSGELQAFSDVTEWLGEEDFEDAFAWSPDSRHLAFSADIEADKVFALYTVRADGGELTKVSGSAISDDEQFLRRVVWSLDGGYLAFLVDTWGNNSEGLYIAQPGNTHNHKVAPVTNFPGIVRSFTWSPVSNTLAFSIREGASNLHDLYVTQPVESGWGEPMNLSGNTAVASSCGLCDSHDLLLFENISFGNQSVNFAWSRDGKSIFYSGVDLVNDSSHIFKVLADVADEPVKIPSVDESISVHYAGFLFSPDERHLAISYWNEFDEGNLSILTLATGEVASVDPDFDPIWFTDQYYWSPDSQRLLITYWWDEDEEENSGARFFVADATGEGKEISLQPELQDSFFTTSGWLNETEVLLHEIDNREQVHDDIPDHWIMKRFDATTERHSHVLAGDHRIIDGQFSADRRYVAVLNAVDAGTELTVCDLQERVNFSAILDFHMDYSPYDEWVRLVF